VTLKKAKKKLIRQREAVEPENRRAHRTAGHEDPIGGGVQRVSGRHWRRSTWLRNTGSRPVRRQCGSGWSAANYGERRLLRAG